MDFDFVQVYYFLVYGGRYLEEIIYIEIMVCIIYYIINCRQRE